MKCVCGTAFCWLCGKQIDDAVFPKHFQWWNANSCANMQMNGDIQPSFCSRVIARVLSLLQIIILGPITLVSTCLSSLICPCILPLLLRSPSELPPGSNVYADLFTSCLSGWGYVYTFLLVLLPLFLVAAGFGLAMVVVVYPAYAVYRCVALL